LLQAREWMKKAKERFEGWDTWKRYWKNLIWKLIIVR
jgi:hypothetical protein